MNEFATFFKVDTSDDMDADEISKFMEDVIEHLNSRYAGEAVFLVLDIKGKPASGK